MASSWQSDKSAGLPCIDISAIIFNTKKSLVHVLFNYVTLFAFMDNLCNGISDKVHALVMGPFVCFFSFYIFWYIISDICDSSSIYFHSRSISVTSILATWYSYSLFWCSSVADSLLHGHVHYVLLQSGSSHEHQYLTAIQQSRWVYFCPATCSAFIATPEHLLQSMSQCRDKILVIFLFQQCLKPAGVLSLLQTDWVYFVLQQFLQLSI